jgi:protein-S-isoprenylcysteine O-methyltransferase Ste14
VKSFYVSGKGRLAPWAPPEKLLVLSLYRYSRNPIYILVALVWLVWGVSFGSLLLYVYAPIVVTTFQIRVVWDEEPWLERKCGSDWNRYSS